MKYAITLHRVECDDLLCDDVECDKFYSGIFDHTLSTYRHYNDAFHYCDDDDMLCTMSIDIDDDEIDSLMLFVSQHVDVVDIEIDN